MKDDQMCGAKTRAGTPCKRAPSKGSTRCMLHGGKSLKGSEHPGFKTGLYSKHVYKELGELIRELSQMDHEDLINPENEIRLMQALIISAKSLKNGTPDLADLDMLTKIIERLVKAKQRSQSIMIEQRQLIPLQDVTRFLERLEMLLIDRFGEEQGLPVLDELKKFNLN